MTSQGDKKSVGARVGGGSPTNPDSTCQDEINLTKIEARIQAMEDRLSKDQDNKFNAILDLLKGGSPTKTTTQQTGLEAGMKELKEKIEFLLSGENEASKAIEEMKRVDDLHNTIQENEKRLETFRQVVFEEMKGLLEEIKGQKKYVKDIEHEVDNIRQDMKEVRDLERRNMELVRSNNKKLDVVERQTRPNKRRRQSTRSRSGSSRSGSRRRSKSTSTSRSRRKSSRGKRHNHSRDSSASAAIQMKGNDFEKLLVQINDSIGVLGDKVEKSDVTRQVGSLQNSIESKLLTIKDSIERSGSLLGFPAPKWDEDASPSPLHRKPPGTPSTVSEGVSVKHSEDRFSVKSSGGKSKKKRKRSRSCSSSSSDEEQLDSKDIKQNVKIIGNKVTQIDLRLKEMSKSLKKAAKTEDNSATVLKRIGEMTMGVQIIAENVDSMNDINKRLETLDEIKDSLESLDNLDNLPKRLKSIDEKVDSSSHSLASLSDKVSLKLRDIEGYVDGSKGRRVTTDEYGDVTNLLIRLEEENSKKFCEFGGLVEDLQSDIVKRLEKMEANGGGGADQDKGIKGNFAKTLLEINEKLIDHVKNVEKMQKKEILPILNNLMTVGGVNLNLSDPPAATDSPSQNTERAVGGSGGGGVSGATEQRIAAVVLQLSQLQPRLDDLYTRVLPSLENLTSRVRKVEDRERLASSEDSQHIQKILDLVEDLKEERLVKVEGGGGSNSGLSPEMRELISANREKVEDVFKAVFESREVLTTMLDERMASSKSDLAKLLGSSDKHGKMLDSLVRDSKSDASTMSGLSTNLQSMKASLNGVNNTAKDLRETLTGVASKVTDLESTSVAVETKIQTDVVLAFATLKDDIWELIDNNVKEMIVNSTQEIINSQANNAKAVSSNSKQTSEPIAVTSQQLSKLQESVDKSTTKLALLEVKLDIANNTKSKTVPASSSVGAGGGGALPSKLSEDLDTLGKEIKSQLDDVHDMVASMEEKTTAVMENLKNDHTVHDKHTGVMFNRIARVLQDIVDNSKKTYDQFPGLETNIINAIKSASNHDVKQSLERLEVSIKEAANSSATAAKLPEHNELLKMSEKLDQINGKQDKVGKIVGRIKFLVEEEDGPRGADRGGGQETPKKDVVPATDSSNSNLEILLNSLRSTIEDELNSQGDMLADITNHIQELSEKVATREVVKAIGEEIRQRMEDVGNGLTDMSALVKEIPDQYSAQNTVLEENLTSSVLGAVKGDIQKHLTGMNDTLFEFETTLYSIKKLLKRGGGTNNPEEKDENALKGVIERVEEVSRRLETVQSVLENAAGAGGQGLDTALVLAEVRKRAESEGLDRLSQDMFKAVHNVQGRLLAEHKRLMNRLTEMESSGPDSATMQLITSFNKVQTIQTELLGKQDEGLASQEESNRLLARVVSTLESTRSLLTTDTGGGQMTGRMADLCDELSATVKDLISSQAALSNGGGDCFQRLDSLLKSAAAQFKVERGLGCGGGGGVSTDDAEKLAGVRRRPQRLASSERGGCSPLSDNAGSGVELDADFAAGPSARGRVALAGSSQAAADGGRLLAAAGAGTSVADLSDELMTSPGKKN